MKSFGSGLVHIAITIIFSHKSNELLIKFCNSGKGSFLRTSFPRVILTQVGTGMTLDLLHKSIFRFVIPAQAGIQCRRFLLDSRIRGNDGA
jgi:hypothetical protein